MLWDRCLCSTTRAPTHMSQSAPKRGHRPAELVQHHTTVPEHHDVFLSDRQGQAPSSWWIFSAIALPGGVVKRTTPTHLSQGRLSLAGSAQLAPSQSGTSLLLLPCACTGEEGVKRVPGTRMSLKRAVLLLGGGGHVPCTRCPPS